MTDILNDLNWRYAVKKFDSERLISAPKIERLKKAFNLTATSYGLQPIRLVVLQNKQLQKELVTPSFGQLQVEQASHVLVICIENKIDSHYIADYFDLVKKIRGTSEEILNPFKKELMEDFSKKDRVQLQQWSKNQAYLAMGNLLTVCAVEKIDACPMEGFNPLAYDEILGLQEKRIASVLVLPIGYRAADDQFADFKKVRKPIAESIIDMS